LLIILIGLFRLQIDYFLNPEGCDLPFNQYGKHEFAEALMDRIAMREGIGDVLAESLARAAIKWGRL
jgi:aldehyde:ferredoxin oxidoreductase